MQAYRTAFLAILHAARYMRSDLVGLTFAKWREDCLNVCELRRERITASA